MGGKFDHLSMRDRIRLETLIKAGHTVIEIANMLGVHRSTIYREIKRGRFVALNTNLTEEERYSPDIAQEKYEENLKCKGSGLKIANDMKLANYIEEKIVDKKYSPAAVLGEIKAENKESEFSVMICTTTLYSYINKGIFLCLTNKDLPVKKNKKRKKKTLKRQARTEAGESIKNRPEEVDAREVFGHWEMDTVKGKRGKSRNSLLVLTERKTRNEIVTKISDGTTASVVNALDMLERKWGEQFKKVFKTITVDNGSEFADCTGMERSIFDEKKHRTKIYYCHPYSSWERGSNEVTNKLIRRHLPKGVNFDNKTEEEIANIENWINTYPRKIHGWSSAEKMFKKEIEKIG